MSIRTPAQSTDSALLGRYVCDGNEAAFGQLVNRYQHLVLGTAYRRGGDLELARDVAQQVFAALARKANLLVGRESLAGWLHQAVMFETCRAVQSESRRRMRHELLRRDEPNSGFDSPDTGFAWTVLDEAIDRLGFVDREAIALHYFQDLSYTEMAAVLGLNETAVRKRVSRALKRLGENLRERGVKQTAAAVLAGAVALQHTVGVHAGLAQAALAIAAAGGTSAFLSLTATLSKPIVKIAAVIAVGTALVFTIWPDESRRQEQAQRLPVVAPAVEAEIVSQKASTAFAARLPVADTQPSSGIENGAVSTSRNVAPIQLRGTSSPRAAAQPKVVPVLSPGQRQNIAQIIAERLAPAVSPAGAPLDDAIPATPAAVPQPGLAANPAAPAARVATPMVKPGGVDAAIADLLVEYPDLPDLLRQLELLPSEAADFTSDILDEVLHFTPVEKLRLTKVLEKSFVDKALVGLAGPRPETIAETVWIGTRAAVLSDTINQVTEAVPAAAAVPDVVQGVLGLADLPSAVSPDIDGSLLQVASESSETVEAVPELVVEPLQDLLSGSGLFPLR